MRTLLWLSVTLAVTACAEDLRPDQPDAGPPAADGGDASRVVHTDNGDGTTTSQVDATSEAAWVRLDLESKDDVDEAPIWDLAFQRFTIAINGGISGDADMAVAVLPGADFDALAVAPADGYVTDAADGEDEDADPDLAFHRDGGWYLYDMATHVLTPRDLVYVVRSVEHGHFKLQMTDYYDEAGTSGFPTFRWAPVDPPVGS